VLPITPEEVTIKIGNNNKTIDLINGGEINILKAPGLTEISFDFEIPSVKYPYRNKESDDITAQNYINILKELKVNRLYFPFKILREEGSITLPESDDMKVSLEEYTLKESAKNGTDITASVKLKEYREYNTKTQTATVVGTTSDGKKIVRITKKRPSNRVAPDTYTVKKGDTLWTICKSWFDDGSKYKEIAKLNGISNPNKISVGQVIRLR
jgi:nucleoid-associated protein YgaU